MNYKTCPVCGKQFPCPPSDKTVTCSKECSLIRKRQSHIGKHNKWNSESKKKLKEQGQTGNLKLGTESAKKSQNSGPFETNVSAKHWVLRSPDNVIYEIDNLSLFVRAHPEWFPNPKSATTALSSAASCMEISTTPQSRKGREFSQYKGWQVISRTLNRKKDG